jgi:LacI family gluconate utilization system Gnt-I transcriptional repressor
MPKAPKMKDVAAAAGVSPMTVSRAFKRDTSVNAETREKILKAADDLGYVFDSTASNLRSQKSGFVAVTIPSLDNSNFADTVGAITDVLSPHGMQILMGATGYDVVHEERLIEQFLGRRPEAIIVTGGQHTERTRRMLKNAGIPVIETWDLPEEPLGHVVGFSNAATMEEMVDHLVGLGKSHISFIGGDSQGDTRGSDRRRGFLEALRKRGLPTDRLIDTGKAPVAMRQGAAAMAKLLQGFSDTDAVVCVSDLSAFGALTECQRRGINVPQDMVIAGFGAYDISEVCVPTLTTIDASSSEIGRMAGQLVLELLKDNLGPARVLEVQPNILVRQSTG